MYDVVVIGAGAAGLMAAGVAARSGRKVLLLEKMERPGRKIRITGKGRCNLTNMHEREEFLSKIRSNAEFFATAYAGFDNKKTVTFFKRQKVDLTIERGERVYPTSGKAWDISNALAYWCKDMGVETLCHTTATMIRTTGRRVCGVEVLNKRGFPRRIETLSVIVCTGGASYPATGSTGDGYKFAHALGHNIEAIRPSLVPLEYTHPQAGMLAGVFLKNVDAKLWIDGEVVREEFGEVQFSDRGIEGALILKMSRDAVDALIDERKVEITLDLKPALTDEVIKGRIERELAELHEMARISELLRKLLPRQLVEPMAHQIGLDPEARVSTLDEAKIADIITNLKNFRVEIIDYRPFEEAIVTAGGVDVSEVDDQTLESKLVKGLYFAGEILDIDADTGGYNLQVAFSTGALAGRLIGLEEFVLQDQTATAEKLTNEEYAKEEAAREKEESAKENTTKKVVAKEVIAKEVIVKKVSIKDVIDEEELEELEELEEEELEEFEVVEDIEGLEVIEGLEELEATAKEGNV